MGGLQNIPLSPSFSLLLVIVVVNSWRFRYSYHYISWGLSGTPVLWLVVRSSLLLLQKVSIRGLAKFPVLDSWDFRVFFQGCRVLLWDGRVSHGRNVSVDFCLAWLSMPRLYCR